MKLTISANLLRGLFSEIYFINGTACAGKSTAVRLLAERHDGILCGENYHDCFRHAATPEDQPNLSYLYTMRDWQQFVNRTPDAYDAWIRGSSAEAAEMEIIRLIELAGQGKKIFVDTNLSAEWLHAVSSYHRVAIMLAPPRTSVDRFFAREDEDKQFILSHINASPDPAATMANYRACLEMLNSEEKYRAWERSGFRVFVRDENRTPEQTVALLEAHFGLACVSAADDDGRET